ncbi:two-component system response regulator [Shewanella youngdeokensis]|uniref:Two-component system response regulator n=1 Tax=Shewanella youngdeokensis TaxID=2999068 RepID=A0ABZ0K2Z2_9GAMM|nr:two-component system response regulator [Shewanella sp. DAU334]
MEQQTLLIVDDTSANIDVLAGMLKADYKIKVAKSGEIALKLAKSAALDLILLDIMMPGIDGFEVCRLLKEDYTTRHIPIIFVTAKITAEDELKGLELGAVDYITKPLNPPIVQQRVRTHLALFNQSRELAIKVKQKTAELAQTQLKVIQKLGLAAEYKDNETGMHVIRVSHYTHILAKAAGMSETDADMLMAASPMHDIGKIGVDDAILRKPGKLTSEEFELMKMHAQIGADIIGDNDSEILKMARVVAISHHEKWNGSGYPYGLKGEAIPRIGRIVAIADVFDALTSKRPYKRAWSIEEAVNLLKQEAGQHFDPQLVPLFIAHIDEVETVMHSFKD